MAAIFRVLLSLWRILVRPIFPVGHHDVSHPLQPQAPRTVGWRLRRLAGGLFRRVLMAPVMLVVIMVLLVFGTTNRVGVLSARPPENTPACLNIFHRDVRVRTDDGVDLAGWYVPAWSADEFAASRDQGLRARRPGVVLCHGAWADRSQLLSLTPGLHAARLELLLLDMRGCGQSGGNTSLGLEEWRDVAAAIRWMQQLGPVDPQRIALVGCDINAAAVLRAAGRNPAVRAVVLDRPTRNVGTFLSQRFQRVGLPGSVFGRLYEWSFSLSRAADMNQASAQYWVSSLSPGQALLVAARHNDPLTPPEDPYAVLSSARCPKSIKVCRAMPQDEPGQTAIMPPDIVAFLQARLINPPAEPVRKADAGWPDDE